MTSTAIASAQSKELRSFFDDNGYLVVRSLFQASEVQTLLRTVDGLEARQILFPEGDLLWEPSNPKRLRNAFGLIHRIDAFRKIALDGRLVDIVEALIGPDIDIYGDGLFAKPAREGSIVPPHQDMPYWSFKPYKLITAWIALENANLENGCMRVYSGTHKLGMLEHQPSHVLGNSKSLADPDSLDLSTERVIELQAGDVGFHHCLTVHRSDPNRSERSRRGYTVIYMPGDTEYTGAEPYRFPFLHVRGKASPAFQSARGVADSNP